MVLSHVYWIPLIISFLDAFLVSYSNFLISILIIVTDKKGKEKSEGLIRDMLSLCCRFTPDMVKSLFSVNEFLKRF